MASLWQPLLQPQLHPDDDDSGAGPFNAAGAWSRLTFSWLSALLSRGSKRALDTGDLPSLGSEDQAATADLAFQDQQDLQDQQDQGQRSVLRVLAGSYWKQLVGAGGWAFLKSVSACGSPVFALFFVRYAAGERAFPGEGYALAGGIFLGKVVEAVSERQWFFQARRVGMRARAGVMAAVYRKELRLSGAGRKAHPAGEVLNYMAVDAFRVGELAYWAHFVWATPVQIALAAAVLFLCVGWATLAGLGVILLTVLGNQPFARLQQRAQTQLMAAQSRRLRATAEFLRSIKILKLQAWGERFMAAAQELRDEEMGWLGRNQNIRADHSVLFWMSPVLVSSATFAACLALGRPLDAGNVFTALAALRILQEPIRAVPDLIAALIQTRVSLARLDRFLGEDELQEDAVERMVGDTEFAVRIDKGEFSWDTGAATSTLRNINLQVQHGQLVAVCGQVGSGKSSLLMCILGEMPKVSGSVQVSGKTVAYVAQTAWIESGTIQDNILFGKAMDLEKYQSVLQACALVQDIEELPYKDLTEIGERGLNLSGGQKQRIQLARALYQDSDIYLLDDPFSAVDAHTVSGLFSNCVLQALAGKTVILVTHQVEFLPAADVILLLQDGEIRESGNYNQINYEGSEFEKLIVAHKQAMGPVHDGASTAPTPADQLQAKGSTPPTKGTGVGAQLTTEEEKDTGTSSWKAVLDYLRQANGWFYFWSSFLGNAVFAVGQIASVLWLATGVNNPNISPALLVEVYAAVGIFACAFIFIRGRMIATMGLKASASFFSGMTTAIFRAPMSFFDSTPTGRIITRFSSDMNSLDTEVPFSLGYSATGALNYVASLLITSFVTWPALLLGLPLMYISAQYQITYLRSARELVRVDGTTKAPIVQHFAETIAGAVTIRAFGKKDTFMLRTLQLVDANSNPSFHSSAALQWLILRVELLSALVLLSSALTLIAFIDHISPGMAGMAISYALSLNGAQVFTVMNQCAAANQIVAVERIRQYQRIPSEAPAVIPHSFSEPWPLSGEVVLENLQVRYRPKAPLILNGISCTFKGGERVGVVGRTGSGKSTLISALFRLVEPAGGTILIDGVDITTVGLHDLRSRLAIIPQDPALFCGTVRFNLDPLSQYKDVELWEALDLCQLGNTIRAKAGQLDSEVGDDGENWSVGQRQLFCLGRVLLRHSRILVLDEATASIDNNTDSILQKVIRKAFHGCTVITVAHRIPTVVDSDKILALSDGQLVEFNTPSELLAKKDSLFARLVAEYWASHR